MAVIYIDTRSKNLPDSGAWQIHKFGTAAGEQRIALEGNCETDDHLFDFYTKDVEFFFFTKSDMIDYISSIQEEIHHPTQHYSYGDYISFYQNKIQEIRQYPLDFIVMHFEANPRRGGTAYLASISSTDSDRYNFLRSICLSSEKQGKKNAYTTFLFVKYQNTNTGKYYINLVPTFSKKYSMEELANIIRRELSSAQDIHVALYIFGLKYAEQIISENYNCGELVHQAGYDELEMELKTAVDVYSSLKEKKITINPISEKLGILGKYIEEHTSHIKHPQLNAPLQQIFYGAPGTGKSDTIFEKTKDLPKENVHRTTFHPDSDYSTFVGCYKPIMKRQYRYDGKVKAKYYEDDDLADAKKDDVIVDKVIQYNFIPQAFTNAYIKAWQTEEPVYLIIEEINRGNCAQIFGDLFQLLDRDENGYSKYPIDADTDLKNFLAEKFAESCRDDIKKEIKEGDKLRLPNNLYIWATMNTSDQSLFPIDSAFKRRWDWKYIKIKKGIDKETKKELDWKIKVGEDRYDWWEFLKAINYKIDKMTSSADKQLGYFFCLADGNGDISADTFVNKVAFYLWNDVFKDYAEDGSPLLKYKKKEDDKSESDLTFPDFFDESGNVDPNVVKQFIGKVLADDMTDNKPE